MPVHGDQTLDGRHGRLPSVNTGLTKTSLELITVPRVPGSHVHVRSSTFEVVHTYNRASPISTDSCESILKECH